MEFGLKNFFSWNWFIWFHEFFWSGLFLIFWPTVLDDNPKPQNYSYYIMIFLHTPLISKLWNIKNLFVPNVIYISTLNFQSYTLNDWCIYDYQKLFHIHFLEEAPKELIFPTDFLVARSWKASHFLILLLCKGIFPIGIEGVKMYLIFLFFVFRAPQRARKF